MSTVGSAWASSLPLTLLTHVLWTEQRRDVDPVEWVLQSWLCSAPSSLPSLGSLPPVDLLQCPRLRGCRLPRLPHPPAPPGSGGVKVSDTQQQRLLCSIRANLQSFTCLGVSGWTDSVLFSLHIHLWEMLRVLLLETGEESHLTSVIISWFPASWHCYTFDTGEGVRLKNQFTSLQIVHGGLTPIVLMSQLKQTLKIFHFNILLRIGKAGDFWVQKEEISYFPELS